MPGKCAVGRLEGDHRAKGGCVQRIGNLGDRIVGRACGQPGNRVRDHITRVVGSANRKVVIPLVMASAIASIIITPEKSNGCGVIARKTWLGIKGGLRLVDW